MSPGTRNGADGHADLRTEHDALAQELAARRSIEVARRGAMTGFVGLIATGLAVKLAFDRWVSTRATRFQGPPIFFQVALAVGLVLLATAVVHAVRARRLMRGEDERFARLRELRRKLEIDP